VLLLAVLGVVPAANAWDFQATLTPVYSPVPIAEGAYDFVIFDLKITSLGFVPPPVLIKHVAAGFTYKGHDDASDEILRTKLFVNPEGEQVDAAPAVFPIFVQVFTSPWDGPFEKINEGDWDVEVTVDLTAKGFGKHLDAHAEVRVFDSPTNPVPEPSSFALALPALLGLGGYTWIRRRQSARNRLSRAIRTGT
jgi:hypothetical protein